MAAIVELQDISVNAEPSQGSHFFQNITSLDIPYLMVHNTRSSGKTGNRESEFVDWKQLQQHELTGERSYICHVWFGAVLIVKVDGTTSETFGYIQHLGV